LQRHILRLITKSDVRGSVPDLLGRVRFTAASVRDRFSGDTWRILGRLDVDAQARPSRLSLANALTLIHNLVLDLAAFNGMEMENMTRGYGWRFLDIGRRVERGLSVVNLVRAAAGVETRPSAALEAVLEIADSVMTYRRRYFAEARLAGVLELLLRDESNPRALAFQLNVLREHTRELPGDSNTPGPRGEHPRIRALADALRAAAPDDLAGESAGGASGPLLELLGLCATEFGAFSDELTSRYFSHTVPRVS
jgi:uncharacterized alpha-E superfamily protein